MKIKITLITALLSLISCSQEEPPVCNCQVEGNDQIRTVRTVEGFQIIQSSQPIMIFPYDTIVNCDQDQVSWYKVTTEPILDGFSTKTSFRKINCN